MVIMKYDKNCHAEWLQVERINEKAPDRKASVADKASVRSEAKASTIETMYCKCECFEIYGKEIKT